MKLNPPPVKVKICGTASLRDALLAVACGADALGFIFYAKSPRCVKPETARGIIAELPPFVETVGVFVNETAARVNRIAEMCRLDAVQLHGDETPAFCRKIRRKTIKAFRVKDAAALTALSKYDVSGLLLDAFVANQYGGTGKTLDWDLARRAGHYGPVILAGGLTPGNVAAAIRKARPYAVDVSSGVEKSPGVKDPAKLQAFIRAAKNAKIR